MQFIDNFNEECAYSSLSFKFIKKYMKLAQQIANDNNICYSRKIGVVVVDPEINGVVSVGYNGPPENTPHCDSEEFLSYYFWPQLTKQEKLNFKTRQQFLEKYTGCGECPRRLIGAGTGERSELCSCQHAERNALNKLPVSANGKIMFCWCGVPCIQCSGSIINSKIKECHCIIEKDYHKSSRWLFEKSECKLFEYDKKFF